MENEKALTSNQFRNKKTNSENWEPLTYVNASPDYNYPLRILEAFLENAESGELVSDQPNELVDYMNNLQLQRAEILRAAINVLKENGYGK